MIKLYKKSISGINRPREEINKPSTVGENLIYGESIEGII